MSATKVPKILSNIKFRDETKRFKLSKYFPSLSRDVTKFPDFRNYHETIFKPLKQFTTNSAACQAKKFGDIWITLRIRRKFKDKMPLGLASKTCLNRNLPYGNKPPQWSKTKGKWNIWPKVLSSARIVYSSPLSILGRFMPTSCTGDIWSDYCQFAKRQDCLKTSLLDCFKTFRSTISCLLYPSSW